MKRLFSILGVLLCLSVGTDLRISAASSSDTVVRVAIANGSVLLPSKTVKVDDVDADGNMTIHDVLYCAHQQYYDGGAEAGYRSEKTDYGLSLMKLWGIENGGSYGYYCNHVSATNLLDTVNNGDFIYAYAYSDLETWSDEYSYFDADTNETTVGSEIEVKLCKYEMDENWNPVAKPVAGAELTLDDVNTKIKTNESGIAKIRFETAGEHCLSALSSSDTLVPPICIVNVQAVSATESTQTSKTPAATEPVKKTNGTATGDSEILFVCMIGIFSLLLMCVLQKRSNEN